MSKTKDILEILGSQNKVVWDETMRYADKFGRVQQSVLIRDVNDFELPEMKDRVVKVFNNELLEVAEAAVACGLKPLVINEGSDNDPLKVLPQGAIGAEWDLFRRSNLHASLTGNDLYPLRDGSILYAPDVTVFRNDKYKLLKNPYKISVLTVPPLRRPGIVSNRNGDRMVDTYSLESEALRMKSYIEKIFKVALLKGHRCIIVNDFGCQRNCENPIDDVIRMFNDAIAAYPVKYVFFAIVEPQLESLNRDNKKHNAVYKNYMAFDLGIIRLSRSS